MPNRAYFPNDGWVAYSLSHMHGSDLYRVPQDAAMLHFEKVLAALRESAERHEDTPFVKGFINWRNEGEVNAGSVPRLLVHFQKAQREEWATTNVSALQVSIEDEWEFWQRWRRLKWRWANYVFEWTFLTGLAMFAVWPILKSRSRYQFAAHTALLPLLFMLPTYLGYARFSFTSAGLSGGIVYPHLLRLTFGGSCNRLDRWLLAHIPQILEPLSAPIGTWISLSGRGMPGPTSRCILGLLLGVSFLAISLAWKRWTRQPH